MLINLLYLMVIISTPVDLLHFKGYNIYTYTRYAAASPINITK